MLYLKETAIINDGDFSITFHDKDGHTTTKTYNKISVHEVESICLAFVNVTNTDTGDSALWLSKDYGAVERLSSRLDRSYLPNTVPADTSEVRFYNSNSASVIDVVTLTNLPIYLKTEYRRAKYDAYIDIRWVSAIQDYNGIKFSFDSENNHTIEVLNDTAYNGLKYTDGFCIVKKDYEIDNELVMTVYLKLDNHVIECAEPLIVDSKTQEMCKYVRKTVSNKFVAFSGDAAKIIYGKKHVLLSMGSYYPNVDYLVAFCDETEKGDSKEFGSLTPEKLEELIFNITSE